MGLFNEAGTRLTKGTFPGQAANDPLVRVTADVYETRTHDQGSRPVDSRDGVPEGSIKVLRYRAGTILRQSQIDALFPAAIITEVSPAQGPAAGGTVVTVVGNGLDGATDVKFGATSGTNVTVLSTGRLQVRAPAGSAGKVAIAVTDEAGTVTKANAFTYV